jgi:hypothetical protein
MVRVSFCFPKPYVQKINSFMQKFWWVDTKIHWMGKMGISKAKGGMVSKISYASISFPCEAMLEVRAHAGQLNGDCFEG